LELLSSPYRRVLAWHPSAVVSLDNGNTLENWSYCIEDQRNYLLPGVQTTISMSFGPHLL
jgi:hypothetical protein